MQIRCPHCRHPVEVVDEQLFDDVTCPSCGSNISLVSADTTVAHLPAGQRRLGHFELLEQIGVGGFGAVWKARDTVLDRIVALKIPRRGQLDAAEIEYFFRDARAAAQLRHPSIVSVHEVGRDGETVFIASDFIDGANLHEWLSARPLTVREAAELVAQIAEAVQHAHERGVVHRDLKPGNILIDQEGRPHITDFGLAKRETGEVTMTVDGQILGTPAYMSPEQARGKAHEATAASDVYSLGVILFELLTGELPFRGEKRMLMLQILNDEPPSPRKLNGRTPKDLETISLKAMAKEPARRYAAANDFAADLRSYLAGQPILARPVGRVEQAWRWGKRNPAVAALSAAVVLSLIGGTVVSTLYANRAKVREVQAIAESTRADRKTAEALREKQLAATQLSRAEWLLYASQIASAKREWETDHAAVAWKHLSACRRDFRGWEHDYLYTLFNQNQVTYEPGATSVAWSPENTRIAAASSDGTIRLWDPETEQQTPLQVLPPLQAGPNPRPANWSVAFSSDGQQLASGGGDNTITVRNSMTGEAMFPAMTAAGAVTCIAYSLDGQQIVSGSGQNDYGAITIWNSSTGRRIRTLSGQMGEVLCIAISPDGKQVASGSADATLRMWNVASGLETFSVKNKFGIVESVAFTRSGNELLVEDGERGLCLLDATNGQEVRTYNVLGRRIAFSPDGARIVGAYDDMLWIWETESGKELHKFRGHLGFIGSVAFSPDGKRIVSGSDSVKIWDADKAQEPFCWRDRWGAITHVDLSPDGTQIAVASADLVDNIRRSTVKLLDAKTGEELHVFLGHTAEVRSVSYSFDGTQVVSGGSDKTVQVWNRKSDKAVLTLSGHDAEVNCVAFCRDGRRIVSAGFDNALKIWDAATGQTLRTIDGAGPVMAISPDGTHVLSGVNNRLAGPVDDFSLGPLKVWELSSGRETLNIPEATGVRCLAFSHDGNRIASDSSENIVRIWDATSGKELLTLRGHTSRVQCIAFSPDDKRIVTCGAYGDSTVKLWNSTTGQETFSTSAEVSIVDFSADGKRLASAGALIINVWEATNSQPVDQ